MTKDKALKSYSDACQRTFNLVTAQKLNQDDEFVLYSHLGRLAIIVELLKDAMNEDLIKHFVKSLETGIENYDKLLNQLRKEGK